MSPKLMAAGCARNIQLFLSELRCGNVFCFYCILRKEESDYFLRSEKQVLGWNLLPADMVGSQHA